MIFSSILSKIIFSVHLISILELPKQPNKWVLGIFPLKYWKLTSKGINLLFISAEENKYDNNGGNDFDYHCWSLIT
jgi:hypothetical protein